MYSRSQTNSNQTLEPALPGLAELPRFFTTKSTSRRARAAMGENGGRCRSHHSGRMFAIHGFVRISTASREWRAPASTGACAARHDFNGRCCRCFSLGRTREDDEERKRNHLASRVALYCPAVAKTRPDAKPRGRICVSSCPPWFSRVLP
jgi:hypothetical protein